jgi:hypothetical protein
MSWFELTYCPITWWVAGAATWKLVAARIA